MLTSRLLRRCAFTLALALGAAFASAQDFPSKLMTVIVPYPAGGPSDFGARQVQTGLSEHTRQPVIVENVGGVAGAMGLQRLLNAPADGHTMAFTTPMELVLAPLSFSSVKFKSEDLKLVMHIGTTDMVLLTRKDLPYKSVAEMVQASKLPGAKELSFGSLGNGTLYHLVAERFAQLTGMKMLHVPYKGAAPVLQDLMAGQIDMVFMPLAGSTRELISGGKVQALGVTAAQRHAEFPAIPALAAEPGMKDMDFQIWSSVSVPRSTPADVTARLHGALYKALENPQLRKNMEAGGARLAPPKTVAELDRMYTGEIQRFQAVAKSLKLQPE